MTRAVRARRASATARSPTASRLRSRYVAAGCWPLAARHERAEFAGDGVVTFPQRRDGLVRLGGPRGGFGLDVGGVRTAETDDVAQGRVEQEGALGTRMNAEAYRVRRFDAQDVAWRHATRLAGHASAVRARVEITPSGRARPGAEPKHGSTGRQHARSISTR